MSKAVLAVDILNEKASSSYISRNIGIIPNGLLYSE